MKPLTFSFGLLIVITLGAFMSFNSTGESIPTAIIEVTSLDRNEEITFRGKYFTRAGDFQSQRFESEKTPFRIEVQATDFVALFQKLDGSAEMKVSMRIMNNDGEPLATASNVGDVGLMIREADTALTSGL